LRGARLLRNTHACCMERVALTRVWRGAARACSDSLPRGTRITLHLKEDCEDLTEPTKLATLVKTYSEFISFPIEVRIGTRRSMLQHA
jgi:hypothetical protein